MKARQKVGHNVRQYGMHHGPFALGLGSIRKIIGSPPSDKDKLNKNIRRHGARCKSGNNAK
jgi:hypothetical protein